MSKFLDRIKERAKQDKKTIVLAEGEDIRTVKAADMILKEGIADIILLGDKKKIAELATGLDLSKAQILDPATDERRQEFADKFYEKSQRHDAGKGVRNNGKPALFWRNDG